MSSPQYEVVESDDLVGLQAQVSAFLLAGWQCRGGATPVPVHVFCHGENYNVEVKWVQTLVRPADVVDRLVMDAMAKIAAPVVR